MQRVRPYSEHSLRHDDVWLQMDLSLALVVSMLKDHSVPVIGGYDPVGAKNIKEAKRLRRHSRRQKQFDKGDIAFPIPDELMAHLPLIDDATKAIPLPDMAPSGAVPPLPDQRV